MPKTTRQGASNYSADTEAAEVYDATVEDTDGVGEATAPVEPLPPIEDATAEGASSDPTGPDDEEDDVEIPAGNASTEAWRGFVRHQNPPFDVEDKTRDELRDWFHDVHGGGEPDDGGEATESVEDDGEDDEVE